MVPDPANRTQIQIDVAVLAPAEHGRPRRVLSLGEVKWDRIMSPGHLERLRRARDLLAGQGIQHPGHCAHLAIPVRASTANCKTYQRRDIRLIGLDQLYADQHLT